MTQKYPVKQEMEEDYNNDDDDDEFLLSGGYNGPERSYPKKTFNDGLERPRNVLREITEIPRYLDYTVFSKNQLRLAEKIFKTKVYKDNESYIRSQNFFIKLNKPGYWHKTNISVLFDNINTVFDIESEVINQLKEDDAKLFNLGAAKNIETIIQRFKDDFFNLGNATDLTEGDYIKYLKKLTEYDYCVTKLFNLSSVGESIKFADIAALGVVLSLYNKIVSILSYVNPYVMVQKDSGVNTMTPPSFKGSNLDNLYKGMRDNLVANLNDENLATNLTAGEKKKRKVNAFQSNQKKLPDSYKKNPLIRLIQYPLYSLNILLPATIAPVFFMKLNITARQSFKEITKVMATTRVLGRYLKINNSSFYSKIIWLKDPNDNDRLSVKIKITKEKIDLIVYNAGESNITYYKDLIYYVENHVFCYGDIDPSGTYTHRKLMASTSGVDANAKAEAVKAIITLKDKSDPINSDLIAEKNIYRKITTN